jgi:hypothetical protein
MKSENGSVVSAEKVKLSAAIFRDHLDLLVVLSSMALDR